MKFTLAMSIYAKEIPQNFAKCVESVLAQSVMPDEWIIVKDGPLTADLEGVIQKIEFHNEIVVISLPENVTLGPARAEGVKAARHGWVAIMDSDDICLPDRFEKQLAMIEGGGSGVHGGCDGCGGGSGSGGSGVCVGSSGSGARLGLIGGQIAEFNDDPGQIRAVRSVPLEHAAIVDFAKKRNPFNSMTVMMNKEIALAAGNFRYFPWFEDYDLWARMIKAGTICANHPDTLVKMRVGGGMYARRRGVSYIQSEFRMQRQLRDIGLINSVEFIRNLAVRVPPRLLPARGIATIYNRFARN